MYEVIPMYFQTNLLWSKYDKFILTFCIHIPTRYIKEEKKQTRRKIETSNKVKIQNYQNKFDRTKKVKGYNKKYP